jgi:hypothetical protein
MNLTGFTPILYSRFLGTKQLEMSLPSRKFLKAFVVKP